MTRITHFKFDGVDYSEYAGEIDLKDATDHDLRVALKGEHRATVIAEWRRRWRPSADELTELAWLGYVQGRTTVVLDVVAWAPEIRACRKMLELAANDEYVVLKTMRAGLIELGREISKLSNRRKEHLTGLLRKLDDARLQHLRELSDESAQLDLAGAAMESHEREDC